MKPFLLFLLLFQAAVSAQPLPERIVKTAFRHRCAKPSASMDLDAKINESSGLAAWNGQLWTHNDSGKAKLFALDTTSGKIISEYPLPVPEADFEDLGQDRDCFYLGAFGNNLGDQDSLHIYKIWKTSLLANKPVVGTIAFSWPETVTDGRKAHPNFDCEAMVVAGDSIYLFTKEWRKGRRTRLFAIPKNTGNHTAVYKSTLKTRVLVTGASFDKAGKRLVLCGYNLWLRPFLLVFSMDGFGRFPDKGTKIKIRRPFRQVEGVATSDGLHYYLVNEEFNFLFLHSGQQLHRLELP